MSELIGGNMELTTQAVANGSTPAQWYAVHTRSNFEKRVASELDSKGIETYLPALRETHQWKDRRRLIDVPVFPGYVFIRISDSGGYRLRVLRTPGTVRILGAAGRIEPIPETEIASIQFLLTSGAAFFAHPFLREGVRARVKRGALKDLEGVLIRFKNRTRLVLSINLLAQSVAAEVDVADVEPI
jgi:transcription antitermination factor NusG